MPKDYLPYLETILQECRDIEGMKAKGLVYNDLLVDVEKKKAILFSVLNVGEYSNKIPVDVKLKWSELDWIKMVGIRNRIAHDYLGVDLSIVWKIISYDIPKLIPQIEKVLEKERKA